MSKLQGIEISFPVPVSIPDGFERALEALVEMVCKQYERENPTQVMWTAGFGSKPRWSKADAAFLGVATDGDAPESGEPEWDDSVFTISCSEREDFYGANPHNPDCDRLQAELRAVRAARKAKANTAV